MKIKEGGVMDLQKEREAFEAWANENIAKGRMMNWQEWCWEAWQAAKAQAVPEVATIGNELQSWVAVHSFAAKDGNDIVCAVDANALAEEIEKLTGANA